MPSPRPLLLVLLAVVALSVAACDLTRVQGPRSWTAAAESVNGRTFTVTVRDTSGRIDNVEIDPAGVGGFGAIANPPGQTNVLIVPWTGGTCDEQTDIEISADVAGLAISTTTTTSAAECDAMGVGHVLRITGLAAIPAATVTVTKPGS
ncbi:MAG: hypothetical protein ACYC65_01925 [Candidatus Limnocylindrales bacterium]